jgi:Holliday junction resolvase RusA-like endonuclease
MTNDPIVFTVFGACSSMKNSKRLFVREGKPGTTKSAACKAFERDFLLQIPSDAKKGLTGDVEVSLDIFYPDLRHDLDGSICYDLMQSRKIGPNLTERGVYRNDRQVKIKHEHWHLDRENPRVIVRVTEI